MPPSPPLPLAVAQLAPTGSLAQGRAALHEATTALFWQGQVRGICRKVRGRERGFDAGTPAPVFDVAGVGVGVLLCSDARDASDDLRLRDAGAEILAFPLNNLLPRETAERWQFQHLAIAQARARETGCWVLTADVVHPGPSPVAYGSSVILDPHGQVRARVPEGRVGSAQC